MTQRDVTTAQLRLDVLTRTVCGSCSTALPRCTGARPVAAVDSHKVLFLDLPAEEAVSQDQVGDMFRRSDLAPVWALDGNLPSSLDDIEAIVTVKKKVDKSILERCPELKLVAVAFTGFDHVDLDECNKRGIKVANVPGYSTDGVAELAFGMIFSLLRDIPYAYNHLREGKWSWKPGRELKDKKFAVLGTGAIGLRVCQIAKAFGVKEIIGFDKRQSPEFLALGGKYASSLATIFLDVDIVVVNLQLTKETKGIVGGKLMKLLRPDSILVNVARGPLVDQKALAQMLSERRFRAALDVYEVEPLPAEDPLRQVPPEQLVMVPHLAYKCEESLQRRLGVTLANILAYFSEHPQNIAN